MSEAEILRWADALSAIARTGLGFTESLYEQERFQEVLKVAAEMRVNTVSPNHNPETVDEVLDAWIGGVSHGVSGYVTPKVAVGAAVQKDNELLLVQRADSHRWLYPTGWADVGYTPAEVVLKEVYEETGVQAKVVRPIAIFDSYRMGISKLSFYSILFHCQYVEGELAPHALECADVGWFTKEALPKSLAGHKRWIDIVFSAFASGDTPVYFDPPRSSVIPT